MASSASPLPTILPSELNPEYQWVVLGHGGEGNVYKALLKGSEVAVKVFYQREGIAREMEAYEKIGTSPYIVHVHGHGLLEGGQRPFIVMEYAPLGNLDSYLKEHFAIKEDANDDRKKEKEKIMSLMALDICRGVMDIHSHKSVHRDLKLLNILVVCSSFDPSAVRLKICDLGSAKEYHTGMMTSNDFTPQYMAPEMFADTPHTTYRTEVDVYAIGMILYRAQAARSSKSAEIVDSLESTHQEKAHGTSSSLFPSLKEAYTTFTPPSLPDDGVLSVLRFAPVMDRLDLNLSHIHDKQSNIIANALNTVDIIHYLRINITLRSTVDILIIICESVWRNASMIAIKCSFPIEDALCSNIVEFIKSNDKLRVLHLHGPNFLSSRAPPTLKRFFYSGRNVDGAFDFFMRSGLAGDALFQFMGPREFMLQPVRLDSIINGFVDVQRHFTTLGRVEDDDPFLSSFYDPSTFSQPGEDMIRQAIPTST